MTRLLLPPIEVVPGASREPVRIFVGSEHDHFRAERVFAWSVMRTRNPARAYEIEFLRDLPGFDRRRWRTGFTNYRFEVPALAGGGGRAIYNDVDQIYGCDPAELFDLDLDGHSLRALQTPGGFDSAVMLLDCERMAALWTSQGVRRWRRRRLEGIALQEGEVGALDPRWHVREHEFDGAPGHGLLHFTTLQSQPWRPQPDRFVYRDGAGAACWHALEAEADAAGFELPRDARDSEDEAASQALRTCGADDPQTGLEVEALAWFEARGFRGPWVCLRDEAIADLSPPALTTLIQRAFEAEAGAVVAHLEGRDGPQRRRVEARMRDASRRHPAVRWCLGFGAKRREVVHGGPVARGEEPRVWWIGEGSPAESLLSPALSKVACRLERVPASVLAATRGTRLAPDLVIASGREGRWAIRQLERRGRGFIRCVGIDLCLPGIDLVVRAGPRRRSWRDRLTARLLEGRSRGSRGTPRPMTPIARMLVRGLAPRTVEVDLEPVDVAAREICRLLGIEASC